MASAERASGTCRKGTRPCSTVSRARDAGYPALAQHIIHHCRALDAECYYVDGVSGAGLWHMLEGNAPLQQRAELKVQATQA